MFYLKLAWNNLRKSLSVTAPFLLASTVLYMLNCIVLIIMMSPVSESMRHGFMLLGLAIFVLIIFATIMEIYSYNFLLKQRSREFGLFYRLSFRLELCTWGCTDHLLQAIL